MRKKLTFGDAPFKDAAAIIERMNGHDGRLNFKPIRQCGAALDELGKTPAELFQFALRDKETWGRILNAAQTVSNRFRVPSRVPHFVREVVGAARNIKKADEPRRKRVMTFFANL